MQFEAKTVEEATKKGLEALGIAEEQAEITVIEQPVKGLFGRLKGKAVVDVVKKEEEQELVSEEAEKAEEPAKAVTTEGGELREAEFLKKLLELLEINAEVKVNTDGENETLTLVTDKSSSVIGYRGEVLDAMQTLTGAVANIGSKKYRKVMVDCENYRDKREETLIKLAKRLEEKATEMRREVHLEPMNPFERRIIHTALADSRTVTTRSEGKEPNRFVAIVPNDLDEYSRPFNAGKSKGSHGNHRDDRRRNDRQGGGRGRGFGGGNRGGRNGRSGGFTEEKRKTPSGFGTYLGNSLKDNK